MSRQIINDSSPSETSGQVGTSTINQIENEQTLQEVNTETLTSGQVGASTISQVEEERDFYNASDTYEKEFIINGGFDTNSDWTITGGEWDISNGKANIDSNVYTILKQDVSLDGNLVVSVDVTEESLSGGFIIGARTFDNTYRELIRTGTAYESYSETLTFYISNGIKTIEFWRENPALNTKGSIDNVSVKEVVPFDDTSGQAGASTINQIEEEKDFFNDSDTYEKEFVTNGDWYSHRDAYFEITNDLIYIENDGNTYGGIEQSFSVSLGSNFKLKYNAIEGTTSTNWRINIGSSQGSSDLYYKNQISDFTEDTIITSTSDKIWIRIYNNTPNIGDNFSIDNVSVKEVVPFDDTSGQVGTSTINQIENERIVTS